jgi:GTP-binding protein EngB required for normal cell division
MGNERSRLINREQENWEAKHVLHCIPDRKLDQQKLLSYFGRDLKLACVSKVLPGRIEYLHYFVTDSVWTIEFGDGSVENAARSWAKVHNNEYEVLNVEKTFKKTDEIVSRMSALCGASSYSLALRNSEHFARYIQSGTWYSLQMTGQTDLYKSIAPLMGSKASLVNTMPEELKVPKDVTDAPIYPTWRSPHLQPVFERHLSSLTPDEVDMNLLILGPTGAGKSSIVNILFNQKVATVKPSAQSVTKQMEVYQGHVLDHNDPEEPRRRINVIDSVGFCDSQIPPDEVLRVVKGFIKTNVLAVNKVLIVCSGRIESEQAAAIKNIMKWLGYSKHKSEFVFLYNKAESISEAERVECLGAMCDMIEADSGHSVLVPKPESGGRIRVMFAMATGFNPKAGLDDVQESMEALYNAVFLFRADAERLVVTESNCPLL